MPNNINELIKWSEASINLEELDHSDFPNTKIVYGYRDASNYKESAEVVFSGKFDHELLSKMLDKLQGGMFFIPGQVGLPDIQNKLGGWSEDDHPFHYFLSIEPTSDVPTEGLLNLQEFVASFPDVWDATYVPTFVEDKPSL